MKKQFIISLFIFLCLSIANNTSATTISCNQVGGTTFCSDGSSYSQVGNTIFGSDGSTYSKVGNTIFGNTTYSNNSNPINSMMVAGEQQTQTNNQKEASLKSTYGLNNFYSCHSSISSCDSKIRDLTSPTNMAICLINVEGCLERTQMAKESSPIQTQSGYQVCGASLLYPNMTWDGTYGSNGKYDCVCQTGYIWKTSQNSCIRDGYQVCSNMNATWDGTSYTSSGNFNCTCNTGYISSSDSKSCIATTTTVVTQVAPVKSQDQLCKDTYGPNSIDSNDENICKCSTGYQLNQSKTQCIPFPVNTSDKQIMISTIIKKTPIKTKEIKAAATTFTSTLIKSTNTDSSNITGTTTIKIEVKPISFWTRFKGWLGFK